MAKKVEGYIKLQIPAGKATPAPPVGPALGQKGVNIVQFTKEFNARTADQDGIITPVVITVYADRSFSFVTKTPPAAVLLKKACNLKSGSSVPKRWHGRADRTDSDCDRQSARRSRRRRSQWRQPARHRDRQQSVEQRLGDPQQTGRRLFPGGSAQLER